MDKYESRRTALKKLVESMGHGAIAAVAGEIGKSPSYVSRMLYEPGKAGAKRIGEDTLELLANAYPHVFARDARQLGSSIASPTSHQALTHDVTEMRMVLAIVAQALAASTPIAGRELVKAIREKVGSAPQTFAGELVKGLEAELSELADTFPRKHKARGSR